MIGSGYFRREGSEPDYLTRTEDTKPWQRYCA
jgi:hypothetical protein